MKRACLLLTALLTCAPILAQQDITAPSLIDFSITPQAFDTGTGMVNFFWCATVQDDLSGVESVQVTRSCSPGSTTCSTGEGSGGQPSFPLGTLDGHGCAVGVFPQFSPYGTYFLFLRVEDYAGNVRFYQHNPTNPGIANLCSPTSQCEVENRPASGLLDQDADTIPDDSDNCPTVANVDQIDADLDLIGDACDPFPNDRDNEQAQCEADLATCTSGAALLQCQANGAALQAQLATATADTDGDGKRDLDDACAGTLTGAPVDAAGCSQAQFCASFDGATRTGKRACKRADWKNDEPMMKGTERDCDIDKGVSGAADDRCVGVAQ